MSCQFSIVVVAVPFLKRSLLADHATIQPFECMVHMVPGVRNVSTLHVSSKRLQFRLPFLFFTLLVYSNELAGLRKLCTSGYSEHLRYLYISKPSTQNPKPETAHIPYANPPSMQRSLGLYDAALEDARDARCSDAEASPKAPPVLRAPQCSPYSLVGVRSSGALQT